MEKDELTWSPHEQKYIVSATIVSKAPLKPFATILASEDDLEELCLACEYWDSPISRDIVKTLRELQRKVFPP